MYVVKFLICWNKFEVFFLINSIVFLNILYNKFFVVVEYGCKILSIDNIYKLILKNVNIVNL